MFNLFGQEIDNVVVYDARVAHAMVMLSVVLTPAVGHHPAPATSHDRVINMFWLCCISYHIIAGTNPPLIPIDDAVLDTLLPNSMSKPNSKSNSVCKFLCSYKIP